MDELSVVIIRWIASFAFVPLCVLIYFAHKASRVPPWLSGATAGAIGLFILALTNVISLLGIAALDNSLRLFCGNAAVVILAVAQFRILFAYVRHNPLPPTIKVVVPVSPEVQARMDALLIAVIDTHKVEPVSFEIIPLPVAKMQGLVTPVPLSVQQVPAALHSTDAHS